MYRKGKATVVVKTPHSVSFTDGILARKLIGFLQRMPGDAKLFSIGEEADGTLVVLTFESESVQDQSINTTTESTPPKWEPFPAPIVDVPLTT